MRTKGTKPGIRMSLVALLWVLAVLPGPGISTGRADGASTTPAKFKKPVQQSVDRALAFLAKQQVTLEQITKLSQDMPMPRNAKDLIGSFGPGLRGNTGVAGLSVKAFLAAGHRPGKGPYGKVIDHGIDYLLRMQQPNGMLASSVSRGPMYAHCITTLTLAEVSGMVDKKRQKRIDAVLPKALDVILKAQKVRKRPRDTGGWRYKPTSLDSDLSVTGWAVMALHAGRLHGATVPKEATKLAVEYILKCRYNDGSFHYQSGLGTPTGKETMTGLAILCLQLSGEQKNKAVVPAADWLYKRVGRPQSESWPHYRRYYCSRAMFELGGKYWEKWAVAMYTTVLKEQADDGSWTDKYAGYGPSYSTAMAVLAMTVSYPQLPVHRR